MKNKGIENKTLISKIFRILMTPMDEKTLQAQTQNAVLFSAIMKTRTAENLMSVEDLAEFFEVDVETIKKWGGVDYNYSMKDISNILSKTNLSEEDFK